ncbi:MAG: glycosyltransferase [Chitinophagaceae bacterium]|nr:MAG: glycosyltransferase [Chitinophagaceae bacterium]
MKHEFIPWTAATEIEELKLFDIGIMPLLPDPFSEGKCGFKLIQYMAVAVPGVASPTGANEDIVDNEINGFICKSEEEWLSALKYLIENAAARKRMGSLSRQKIIDHYSIKSQEKQFLENLWECYKANMT